MYLFVAIKLRVKGIEQLISTAVIIPHVVKILITARLIGMTYFKCIGCVMFCGCGKQPQNMTECQMRYIYEFPRSYIMDVYHVTCI